MGLLGAGVGPFLPVAYLLTHQATLEGLPATTMSQLVSFAEISPQHYALTQMPALVVQSYNFAPLLNLQKGIGQRETFRAQVMLARAYVLFRH